MADNTLYYGDNLDILRRHIKDETIDLIYLDPPFNSKATYNVLFAEHNGSQAAAQIKAFEDTWHWDQNAAKTFEETTEKGGDVAKALLSFRSLLGDNDMLAYLTMMAPRLLELKRVLKATGSVYLHCDPTASHYLKVLMDAVFKVENFLNEIIWRRTGSHNKMTRYGPIHDVILFYSKSSDYKWNHPKRPFMRGHIEQYFEKDDQGYKTAYYGNVLTGSGIRGGESGKPWKGFDPTAKHRHWAIPAGLLEFLDEDISGLSQHEKLNKLFDLGYITIVPGQAWPVYNRYLKQTDGQPVSDIWAFQPYTEGTVFGTDDGIDTDVRWLSPRDQERLGYPTQKPEGLLERIISASSKEGDLVLDPFCGCGTATAVAQRLNRRWIGIDITHLAITLIKSRLADSFGNKVAYHVVGEPTSLPDAQDLAEHDPYQFQWWALGLVGARPIEEKKGADKGIDGRLYFHDEGVGGKTKQVIFSVKAGHIQAAHIRDLLGVITREKAEIAVLITMQTPTQPMKAEAASAGFYDSPGWKKKYPRCQILTIEELLNGKQIDMPPLTEVNRTFKKAEKAEKKSEKHRELAFNGEDLKEGE